MKKTISLVFVLFFALACLAGGNASEQENYSIKIQAKKKSYILTVKSSFYSEPGNGSVDTWVRNKEEKALIKRLAEMLKQNQPGEETPYQLLRWNLLSNPALHDSFIKGRSATVVIQA